LRTDRWCLTINSNLYFQEYKENSTSTRACNFSFVFEIPWGWRLCAKTFGSCLNLFTVFNSIVCTSWWMWLSASCNILPWNRPNSLTSTDFFYSFFGCFESSFRKKSFTVSRAGRVFGLRMEQRRSHVEGSCECFEQAVADSQRRMFLSLDLWARG